MTLPVAPNSISLDQVNTELRLTSGAQISLNTASVRTLFGSGVYPATNSMSLGRGKQYRVTVTKTYTGANFADTTLNVTTLPGYISGITDVSVIVDTGVFVYATTTLPALTLTGGNSGDTVTLTNRGYILGFGGTGGGSNPASPASYLAATSGNTALKLGFTTSIVKVAGSYIGGGGGGGGGVVPAGGGGGAGGGAGGRGYVSPANAAGGSGGTANTAGTTGTGVSSGTSQAAGGGGGGRKIPGVNAPNVSITSMGQAGGTGGVAGAAGAVAAYGTASAGGGGGGYGASGGAGREWNSFSYPLSGGTGGSANTAGTAGTVVGTLVTTNAGGLAGKAIDFNGFTSSTVSGTGITYGAVG